MRRDRTLRSSTREIRVGLTPDRAWAVVASGELTSQWYVDAAPFVFRGGLDRLLGGHGRRWTPPGRPLLRAGDRAGFWEVLEADPDGRRLTLEAKVRAPGTVRLSCTVEPDGPDGRDGSRVRQVISFAPRGPLGAAYLWTDLPARGVVAELTMLHLLAVLRRAAAA